jgi:hypothetical protein
VAILNEGESFGELALIGSMKGKRAARKVSIKKTSLGVIRAEDYHK